MKQFVLLNNRQAVRLPRDPDGQPHPERSTVLEATGEYYFLLYLNLLKSKTYFMYRQL